MVAVNKAINMPINLVNTVAGGDAELLANMINV
jgi:hypothetical protein